MSAVARLFSEWLGERYPDGPDGAVWHQDDLAEAFEAGWNACYHARWEPVGGLPRTNPGPMADRLWGLLPNTGSADVMLPNLLARQIYQFLRTGGVDRS